MKVLSRYLTGEFLKLFLVFEAVFLFLYLIIDFLQKIDNFIEAEVRGELILLYFLYKAPYVTVQMVPVATSLAVIVLFSLMRNKNEITAIKASGINLYRICQPLVLVALGLGGLTFVLSEIVTPMASSRSNRIWKRDVEKQNPALYYGSDQIWYKGPDWIYWIRHFDGHSKIMENPVLYFFDNSFRLVKKVEGKRGVWTDGRWKLEEAVVLHRGADGKYRVTQAEHLWIDIPETPESFVKGLSKPEEMGYWQLKRYAEEVRREGYDNAKYLVDMNIKTAFPFISLVLVVIGIPVALMSRKGGMAFAVSIGVGVCFLYVLTLGLTRSLGLLGVLPPVLSAWLANLVFSLCGLYLMMQVER